MENKKEVAKELAEVIVVKNVSKIIYDFLQTEDIRLKDIYKFLKNKKYTVQELNTARKQFINYAVLGTETALTKEFFDNLEAK